MYSHYTQVSRCVRNRPDQTRWDEGQSEEGVSQTGQETKSIEP